MAKELAMVENNEMGKAIRKYFIEVENRYKVPMTYEEALEAHLAEVKRNKLLEQQNKILLDTVEEQKITIENQNKDLIYLETIKGSPSAIKVSQLAADYGCSPQDMNNLLLAIGFHKKVNGQWLPKDVFAGHKLTVSKTFAYDRNGKKASSSNECVGSNMSTMITQKGRYRIYQFLKEIGIIPEVEIENGDTSSYDIMDCLIKIGKKMRNQGMRFQTEIPDDIKGKIKEATKRFVNDEKVKTEFCIDEEGKTNEVMVEGWVDYKSEDDRMKETRYWLYE
jgi:phage antirepressor YoqD-like protein